MAVSHKLYYIIVDIIIKNQSLPNSTIYYIEGGKGLNIYNNRNRQKTMTKDEKLDELREWLHDRHITYNEEYDLDGVNLALWIPQYRIGVIDDEKKANDYYPRLTQNHVRMFIIRKNEDKDFIVSKMNNCVRDQRIKKVLRYCWSHFTPEKKRKYKGTYPLNFGRFKKEFNIYLATAQGDINDTLHLYFPQAPGV